MYARFFLHGVSAHARGHSCQHVINTRTLSFMHANVVVVPVDILPKRHA